MIWPKFISAETALVIASLMVSAAMAAAISRLPRIFGQRVKSVPVRIFVRQFLGGDVQITAVFVRAMRTVDSVQTVVCQLLFAAKQALTQKQSMDGPSTLLLTSSASAPCCFTARLRGC